MIREACLFAAGARPLAQDAIETMAAEKSLSTSTAILIAGALIAAGLFFGLRGREAPPPAPAPVVTSAPPPPALEPSHPVVGVTVQPVPVPTPPPAAAGALDQAAVAAAAMKDLEKYRAAVVKKCVEPALAKKPNPPKIKLDFNVSFDPQGRQVMRGVSEDRETMREGVSTCAQDAIPPLSVPPPGAGIQVNLPWTLP
jgi:hypothetical protein